MQIIYKNEDKGDGSGKTDLISVVTCAERISRCLKEEYIGGFGSRTIEIRDCGGIFDRY